MQPKNYDVIVVGSGTAGIYFAKLMVEQGYKVLVIDQCKEADLGKRLNIFHIDQVKFAEFNVPQPQPGDEDYVNLFDYSLNVSAYGKYPKKAVYPFLVSLLPKFLKRLKKWAKEYKVEFSFATSFEKLVYKDEKINGIVASHNGEHITINARLVVDCSGMASIVRRQLHSTCKVDNWEIGPKDQFYVVLRYVKLDDPIKDKIDRTTTWTYYKVWQAPSLEPSGAIFGVGANLSYEYAEKMYSEFLKVNTLPKHKVQNIERGSTPYHQPPYSLVADGFICIGDSACMTKPYSGEGIVAAWKFCKIAAEVASKAMRDNTYPTEELLWEANVLYNRAQGADFAAIMATLVWAIDCTPEENEYEYKHDIIFSEKALTLMNHRFNLSSPLGDTIKLAFKLIWAVMTRKLSKKTFNGLLKGMKIGGKLQKHYRHFPTHPKDFDEWKAKAIALWTKAGSMADKIKQ